MHKCVASDVYCVHGTRRGCMCACVRAYEGLSVLLYSLIVLASIIAPIFILIPS